MILTLTWLFSFSLMWFCIGIHSVIFFALDSYLFSTFWHKKKQNKTKQMIFKKGLTFLYLQQGLDLPIAPQTHSKLMFIDITIKLFWHTHWRQKIGKEDRCQLRIHKHFSSTVAVVTHHWRTWRQNQHTIAMAIRKHVILQWL